MSGTVRMVDPHGGVHDVPDEQVNAAAMQGFHVQTTAEEDARVSDLAEQQVYGGTAGALTAAGLEGLSGATLGASDVALGALDPGYAAMSRALERQHPIVSTGAQIGGQAVGAALTGGANLATGVGERAAAKLGGGALAQIGGKAIAGGLEGAAIGAGQGVHELALSEDPLSLENAVSTLSSNMLFGGAIGGAIGGLGKSAELGLRRAKGALEDIAAGASTGAEVSDVERKLLADDLSEARRTAKEQKLFLATKGVKLEAADGKLATNEIGKIGLDADRGLDRLLRNPKDLAANPGKALAPLRQQEHAYEKLLERADDLRAVFAADTSGTRASVLEAIPAALEKNRALQDRVVDLVERSKAPIKGAATLPQQMLQGGAYGAISDVVGTVLDFVPGGGLLKALRPLAAAKGSAAIGELVFGRLGKAGADAARRAATTVGRVADATAAIAPSAPPLAAKVLGSVRYAAADPKAPAPSGLHETFEARSKEIRSQTAYDETGTPRMTPAARSQLADRLSAVRAINPIAADRLETAAARRIEYLASQLPRTPDPYGVAIGPSSHARHSDFEIRSFARKAAAVEDPHAALDRLADGTLSPEDVEAMRAVYPELHASAVQAIVAATADLDRPLPYERRILLSMFTGRPVDPAMDPAILSRLQSSFDEEPGSEGGTQQPAAAPAFGSVKKSAPEPTPAQGRAAGNPA